MNELVGKILNTFEDRDFIGYDYSPEGELLFVRCKRYLPRFCKYMERIYAVQWWAEREIMITFKLDL